MDENDGAAVNSKEAYEDFIKRVKETALEVNSREALFLPYEVFKQYNELLTENMKQLYGMLHSINMTKAVSVEFRLGDMEFCMTGPHQELDKLTEKAETMIKQILNRLTKKSVIDAIKSANATPRDKNVEGYS